MSSIPQTPSPQRGGSAGAIGDHEFAPCYHQAGIDLYQGDCREVLVRLPTASVQCVVTSPPYWGLRDYGTATWQGGDPACDHRVRPQHAADTSTLTGSTAGINHAQEGFTGRCPRCGAVRVDRQIGLEATVEGYLAALVAVFRAVHRVLRDDGTVWLNLGDTYASAWPCNRRSVIGQGALADGKRDDRPDRRGAGLKEKDLVGIPWRVALALQADGWYLRSDIVWAKSNAMPESVRDRPTRAHEYLFLLSKRPRYYYDADAIREPLKETTFSTFGTRHRAQGNDALGQVKADNWARTVAMRRPRLNPDGTPAGANKRDVWTVAAGHFAGAHFAVFPPQLIVPCILAGTSARGCCPHCGAPWVRIAAASPIPHDAPTASAYPPETNAYRLSQFRQAARARGVPEGTVRRTIGWQPGCTCGDAAPVPCIVLDPFAGSGTTGMVARQHGRHFVGIELSEPYCRMAMERMRQGVLPLHAAPDTLQERAMPSEPSCHRTR